MKAPLRITPTAYLDQYYTLWLSSLRKEIFKLALLFLKTLSLFSHTINTV